MIKEETRTHEESGYNEPLIVLKEFMLRRFLTLSTLTLSLITSGVAQNKEKIKQLAPSAQGSTGLFNLYLADTLRRGEVSLGLNITHFNREPGDLDFTLFPSLNHRGLA